MRVSKAHRRRVNAIILTLLIVAGGITLWLAYSQGEDQKAELRPLSIELNPPSPADQGQIIEVTTTIVNRGAKDADAPFVVDFSLRLGPNDNWVPFASDERRDGLAVGAQGVTATGVLDPQELLRIQEIELPLDRPIEIRVLVDADDRIPELDETNNSLITRLTLTEAAVGPDVQPIDISFNPPSPVSPKDTVRVDSLIRNTGEADTTADFKVEAAFCKLEGPRDSCRDEEFQIFKTVTFTGGLAKRGEKRLSDVEPVDLDIQALGLRPGVYKIRVKVDPDDQVPKEQDEANNELIGSLIIRGPELRPLSITFDKPVVRQGEEIEITAEVINESEFEEGAAGKFRVAFFIDGILVASPFQVDEAPNGQMASPVPQVRVRTDTLTPNRDHTIKVVVDYDGEIPELDEENNVLTKKLTIRPREELKAELVPKTIELNPSPARRDQVLTVSSEILNRSIRGRGAVAEDFDIEFAYRPRGRLLWTPISCVSPSPREGTSQRCHVDRLLIDESVEARAVLDLKTLPPGIFEVRVLADPDDRVNEHDPANNELVTTVTVLTPRRPDLTFVQERILFHPPDATVPRGQDVTISVVIVNLGDAPAAPFDVEFSHCRITAVVTCAAPEEFTTAGMVSPQRLPGLGIGEQTEVTATLHTSALSPGLYAVRVVIDPGGEVDEQSEVNNELFLPQLVTLQGPDLTIVDVQLPNLRTQEQLPTGEERPRAITQGEEILVSTTIGNVGQEFARASQVTFEVCSLVTEIDICQREVVRIPALGPNELKLIEGVRLPTATLPAGEGIVRVIADSAGEVDEFNEADNEFSERIEILPKPDLVAVKLFFEGAARVELGETAQVIAEMLNGGEGPASRFQVVFTCRSLTAPLPGPLALDDDCLPDAEGRPDTFAEVAVESLAPGERIKPFADLDTSALTAGVYEICAVADPQNLIPETDEHNNIVCTELLVGHLDLAAVEILLSEAQVKVGETVQVIAEIRNAGEGPLIPLKVAFTCLHPAAPADPDSDVLDCLPDAQGIPDTFAVVEIPALAPGEQTKAFAELDTASLAPGIYEICAVADPEDRIPEDDELNNRICTELTLLGGEADLAVTSIDLNPPEVAVGGTVAVTAVVQNIGGKPAGFFQVRFAYRRVGEETFIPFDYKSLGKPTLEPAEQVSFTATLYTHGLVPGQYEIEALIIPGDPDAEANKENNQKTAILVIKN